MTQTRFNLPAPLRSAFQPPLLAYAAGVPVSPAGASSGAGTAPAATAARPAASSAAGSGRSGPRWSVCAAAAAATVAAAAACVLPGAGGERRKGVFWIVVLVGRARVLDGRSVVDGLLPSIAFVSGKGQQCP